MSPETITVTLQIRAAAELLNRLEGEYSPGFDYWGDDPATGPILRALLELGYRIRNDKLIGPGEKWYSLERGWTTD